VFTNKGREKNEKAPDYVVYRSEETEAQSNVEQVATQAAKEVSSASSNSSDEDIPEELF
jgi:hypothetical protein